MPTTPHPLWRHGLVLLIVFIVATTAWVGGLELRRWAWDATQGAHFQGDVSNAFHWGNYAQDNGLFAVYECNVLDTANSANINPRNYRERMRLKKIDYPPLRLTAAWLWYRWVHRQFPDADLWQDSYDFTWPLLGANTIAEEFSAVLIFLLIRMWRRRDARITKTSPPWDRALCGVIPGLFGAAILWFNPAVIWDGHCWPQWDIWPVPFFLAALLLCCVDGWFWAGVCLAIGASLKGQILLGAPILLVWPICRGHFGSAFRLLCGFLLPTALIALPWMRCDAAAYRWLAMVAGAIVCMMPFIFQWKRFGKWHLLALWVAAVILTWPWGTHDHNTASACAVLGIPFLAAIRYLPAKTKLPAVGLLASLAIFAVMPFFGASSSWYTLGFEYGTQKFDFMVTGSGAYNIPRMLQAYFSWPRETTEQVTIPLVHATVTFTQLTRILYAITLLLCGIGAAIHQRRNNARFLVAMVAPWLLFFMILTQMHGRYTVWAAAICPLLAGTSAGLALLAIVVSVVSCMGIAHNQLLFSPRWSPDTLETLNRLDPAPGFVLLVIAGILLYMAVMPRSRMSDG